MTLQEQNNLKVGSRLYFPEIGRPEAVEKDGKMYLRTMLYVRQAEFIRMIYKEGHDYLDLKKMRTYKFALVHVCRGDLKWKTEEIPMKICFSTAIEAKERMEKEMKKSFELTEQRTEEQLEQAKRIKHLDINTEK